MGPEGTANVLAENTNIAGRSTAGRACWLPNEEELRSGPGRTDELVDAIENRKTKILASNTLLADLYSRAAIAMGWGWFLDDPAEIAKNMKGAVGLRVMGPLSWDEEGRSERVEFDVF